MRCSGRRWRGLRRYITTVETTKHRVFQFLDGTILPEICLSMFAVDDAFFLGVLIVVTSMSIGRSRWRAPWRNDPATTSRAASILSHFRPPPKHSGIPSASSPSSLMRIASGCSRRIQDLTLTGLYNVLEKLRAGEALTEKEQDIHERGLVSVMKHLHDQIDAAVFDAYGWPRDLSDEEILARLVELNKERRAEEAKGLVRWLRPEYQAPAAKTIVVTEQGQLDISAHALGGRRRAEDLLAEDAAGADHRHPRPARGAAQARPCRGAGAALPSRPARRRAGGAERPRGARPRPPPRRQPICAVSSAEQSPGAGAQAASEDRLSPRAASRGRPERAETMSGEKVPLGIDFASALFGHIDRCALAWRRQQSYAIVLRTKHSGSA